MIYFYISDSFLKIVRNEFKIVFVKSTFLVYKDNVLSLCV